MQQPPLSVQIRALETELGVRLLLRMPRGVELTEAGQVFLEDAVAILASVARAAERAGRVASGRVGRVSVGFTTSAALHPFVPAMMRDFRAAYPEVTIDLQEDNAAALTRSVARGSLAAALLRLPVDRPPGLAFIELLAEEMVAVLPVGHRLAGEPGALALAELAGERFILVRQPGGQGMYSNLIQACRGQGFEPLIAAEVGHMLTDVSMVAAGVGVSVVPASMQEIRLAGVCYRRLMGPVLVAPLTLIYSNADRSALLGNLVAVARAVAPAFCGAGPCGAAAT